MLADIPADALGAPVHASIDGFGLRHHGAGHYACKRLIMTRAIGILELTSIAVGMELGDVMLKSANVQLLLCRTLCPGKFLLMLGGDIGAVQQAIAAGTARAGEMLVDSPVLANIHPSVLPAISGLNVVGQRQAAGIVETRSVAACISAADHAVKAANVTPGAGPYGVWYRRQMLHGGGG